MFLQACVKNSVHGAITGHMTPPCPLGRHPPGRHSHLGRHPLKVDPSGQTTPYSTGHGQQASGMHPTGMHSCYH